MVQTARYRKSDDLAVTIVHEESGSLTPMRCFFLRSYLPPDALHAATAQEADCVQFVTNDAQFRRVKNLSVAVLRDYLS